jgi:hypothetical protein
MARENPIFYCIPFLFPFCQLGHLTVRPLLYYYELEYPALINSAFTGMPLKKFSASVYFLFQDLEKPFFCLSFNPGFVPAVFQQNKPKIL